MFFSLILYQQADRHSLNITHRISLVKMSYIHFPECLRKFAWQYQENTIWLRTKSLGLCPRIRFLTDASRELLFSYKSDN